jgi:two-component system chemotaxis sensor kinase CheA
VTPSGHEEEFRQLFAEEGTQRLADLTRHLLALETAGDDDELVASLFRDAHNLKGSAAIVGIDEVAGVAHAMEDLLEQLRSHDRRATPDLVDGLLDAIDGLSALLPAVVAGQDRSAEAGRLELRLRQIADRVVVPVPSGAGGFVVNPRSSLGTDVLPVPAAAFFPVPSEHETIRVRAGRLDELVSLVGESAAANLRLGGQMAARWGVDPGTVEEYRALSRLLNDLQERTMRTRMVPVATITEPMARAVRDLARGLGKLVHWEVQGGDTELDRGVLQQLADPLMHLVRNAVDHGVESPAERRAAGKPEQATLVLAATQVGSEVVLSIRDDGRGIDVARVREQAYLQGTDVSELGDHDSLHLILRSGLSTAAEVSELSGRGVGLDAVRAGVDAVRGRIEVHSDPGRGTEFRLAVPITLAVLSCLVVAVGDEHYALPMHAVVVTQRRATAVNSHAGGRPLVWVGDTPVPVSGLAAVLWQDGRPTSGGIVVVVGTLRRHAFLVDRLVGQRDVVVKGLGPLVPRLDLLAGASVEADGSVLLVLDVEGLIERARTSDETRAEEPRPSAVVAPPVAAAVATGLVPSPESATAGRAGTILIVDDAAIVRQLERFILERAGYEVLTANDGIEALAQLSERACDLVLTDLEMPRMDGFALTEAIRSDSRLANLPVLLITSRSSETSRQRGLAVGADGYIVKSHFDETQLLSVIERFLGRRL